ncbi:MAG: MFS transporter [Actinocatenispora sp.]
MTETTQTPTPTPLWRNRDYGLLWSGNLVSSLGSATVLVALPLLVVAITGKPLQAGGVAAVETVPYIALSLPLGVLVDRYSRRAMLIVAGIVSMLVSLAIPIAYHLDHLSIGLVYGVAAVVGAASALGEIAQVAVLPKLVPESQLGTASGQSELIYNVSALVGPPIGGLMLATSHMAVPFVIDALSFGAMALSVGLIRANLQVEGDTEQGRWREEFTRGFRTLFAQRRLRALTIMTLTGDFLFSGITVLMTLLVKSRGTSAAVIGVVFALSAIGGIVGSLVANRVQNRMGLVRSVVLRSWATVLLFPLLALGIPAILLGVVWALMNVMISYMNVMQMRLTMSLASEEVLGRTQSVVTFGSFAVLPFGAMFTGVLMQYAGPRGTVFAFTAVLAAIAIYSTVSRDLRVEPEEAPAGG